MRYLVEPVSPNTAVPPHPIDGAIDRDGSNWTADQYTFRLIQDGVIRRKPDEPAPATAKAAPPSPAPVSSVAAKPLPALAGAQE